MTKVVLLDASPEGSVRWRLKVTDFYANQNGMLAVISFSWCLLCVYIYIYCRLLLGSTLPCSLRCVAILLRLGRRLRVGLLFQKDLACLEGGRCCYRYCLALILILSGAHDATVFPYAHLCHICPLPVTSGTWIVTNDAFLDGIRSHAWRRRGRYLW